MKKISKVLSYGWRDLLRAFVILFIVSSIFLFELGTLLPNLSKAEAQALLSSRSLGTILENPLYAPHKLMQYLGLKLHLSETLSARVPSAILAIVSVLLFLWLVQKLHTRRVSILSTTLLLTSTLLIAIGRNGTPNVLFLSWFMVVTSMLWLRHTRKIILVPFLFPLIIVSAVYTPGIIWFVALVLIWYWRDLPKLFQFMNKGSIAFGAVFATFLFLPLVYAFVHNPSLIKDWLLIPQKLPTVTVAVSNIGRLPSAYLYRFQADPGFWLVRLPIFDIFTGTMFLLGLYSYRNKLKMERTAVLILTAFVTLLIAALQAPAVTAIMILPFMYIIVGAGIAFLLQQWFTVFPYNPVARTTGLILISICVLFASFYHINRYFIAWAHAPQTKSSYQNTTSL